jgi:hypothetical protein
MNDSAIPGKSRRAYYDAPVTEFLRHSADSIVGAITSQHAQDLVHQQTNAWRAQIPLLQRELASLADGHIFFEFVIPRMGSRADVVLVVDGLVFVVEFKIGDATFDSNDLRQVEGYALDLKHFHEASHHVVIVPVLVATRAESTKPDVHVRDGVCDPVCSSGFDLSEVIDAIRARFVAPRIDPSAWAAAPYRPTPTIIEAAQALYANHSVHDIARNDAGAQNLAVTSQSLKEIITRSHQDQRKSICFVTGVPGAGKTLVGLDIATASPDYENAVFLSGNGPLVEVLREALTRDEVRRTPGLTKDTARRRARSFIQNIHHFRDEALAHSGPPNERVVIFDEAQRAWDRAHTEKFMVGKRGQVSFDLSEPEFLIQIMDRHIGWCVIVALVGGGQEINSGEIGLVGWHDAIRDRYPDWDIYYSDRLNNEQYAGQIFDPTDLPNEVRTADPRLHLATSMRSFRAESLSSMVHSLINGDAASAKDTHQKFAERFPIRITRDITLAKQWVRGQARGGSTPRGS